MTYYTDETISIAAGATATLDRTKLDNTGGSRANSAFIENSTTANSAVTYRFAGTPSATAGHRLDPGDSVEVIGYDNLRNLVIYGAGSAASSVFVSYST